jgi:GDP-4-dehydro-6-deoxy-D-mannose reductase
MRVLVIGANGFVGPHLCRFLERAGDEVVPLHGVGGTSGHPDTDTGAIDVRDARAVTEAIGRARPDAIVHLAGLSSVAYSHGDPVATFEINTLGALNVCIAVKSAMPTTRMLYVSSGEVYGAAPDGAPATEQTALAPCSPYAASKVAAESACLQFARSYGLHVVCARPFNHIGAGQAPTFAIPSFARQLVEARQAGRSAKLLVGNLEPVRDFSHVLDVVAAYRVLLLHGRSGETYNVCSGQGRSVRSMLDELVELVGVPVDIQVDPAKLRPVDIPVLIGDATKLIALGWAPRLTVRDALTDLLSDIRVAD